MYGDPLLQALSPLLDSSMQALWSGLSPDSVLREALTSAYRMGLAQSGAARPSAELLRTIEKSIVDEVNAAALYRELAARTRDPALAEHVRHAEADEQEHGRALSAFYMQQTGRPFYATARQPQVASLEQGLEDAMKDEYDAFADYRDVYLRSSDPRVRDLFFRLMTDELEHATRFGFVLLALRSGRPSGPMIAEA